LQVKRVSSTGDEVMSDNMMNETDNEAKPDELSENELNEVSGGVQGNFNTQNLMSSYNQTEVLASSVQKKRDDTANSILNKI